MTWRKTAERILANEDNRDNRANSPPIVPFSPIVLQAPEGVLRDWHGKLKRLDPRVVPAELSGSEWSLLCEDAWWLYENFAAVAIRQGWDAHGLFGVRAGYPAGGGLAHALEGCRNVVMVEGRAHVTAWGVTTKYNAACGAGLPLIWEFEDG